MRHIISQIFLAALIMLIHFIGGDCRGEGQPFQADISWNLNESLTEGKLFVYGDKYRMDLEQGGQELTVIVDQGSNLTTVVIPDEKKFMELKSNSGMSRMNDPFQGLKYSQSFADEEKVGEDEVAGFICDKYLLSYNGSEILTYWVAQKLAFPIKIEQDVSRGHAMTLTNIETGEIDPGVFRVPEGYSKTYAPGQEPVEVPDWAADIPSAPLVEPPYEKAMSAGDMIRVEPVAGQSIWIKAKSADPAKARAIPFKDGKPLNHISRFNNFAQKGVIAERRHETGFEADEIVITVFEGNPTVTVKYSPMEEVKLAAGESFIYDLASRENIEVRIINISDKESELVHSYAVDGKEMGEDQLAPLKYRTVTLESGDIKKTTLVAKGDQLVFKVNRGQMLIKLGQYDSFEWEK